MSGDLLRRGAIFGDVGSIKCQLEQGSNPCSVDVSKPNIYEPAVQSIRPEVMQ